MIPKKIHYCWFGNGTKPPLAERCLDSWHKYCPDYEIIEWNEGNYDTSSAPLYVRQAYENKKWAFVTDFVRLHVVYEEGGIYLDTDVELIKSLDSFLNYSAFFGFEDNYLVATGLGFGAEKGASVLKLLMSDYMEIPFVKADGSLDLLSCPQRNTEALVKLGLRKDNTMQVLPDNVAVFPTSFFCPLSYRTGIKTITPDTVSIHWYSASWLPEERRKEHSRRVLKNRLLRPVKTILKKILGKKASGTLKKMVYGSGEKDRDNPES